MAGEVPTGETTVIGPRVPSWDFAPATDSTLEWKERAVDALALETSPRDGASFEPPPAPVLRAKSWAAWRKQLEAVLYRDQRLVLWRNAALGAQSSVGESEGDFRARLAHLARALQLEIGHDGADLVSAPVPHRWTMERCEGGTLVGL